MNRRVLLGAIGGAIVGQLVRTEMAQADITDPDAGTPHWGSSPTMRGTSLVSAPTTADGFFQAFQNKNDMDWSGGDQVTSFIHNGYVYWLFGDTMLSNGEDPDGSYPEGTVMVSNRILLQQGSQFVNAMADGSLGVPNPPTHTGQSQERYWAQGMFYANGYLYVLCQRVVNENDTFKLIGAEFAKFQPDSLTGKLNFIGMIVTPSTGKPEAQAVTGIQWANDAIRSGDYIYIYGATLAYNKDFVSHYTYVARVPAAKVENPSAWTFYKKSNGTWVSKIEQLNQDPTNQPDAILPVQVSSVRWVGNKHVMLHKPFAFFSSDIKATTSTTPYGPWTADQTVLQSPNGVNYNTYCPQLHPEQILDSGKTLVSVAWNGKSLADVMNDADLYKPRFYELQF